MTLLQHPQTGKVQETADAAWQAELEARGYEVVTPADLVPEAGGWQGAPSTGSSEPAVEGMSGSPATDAPHEDWEHYARQFGVDPTPYPVTADLINAVKAARGIA